ncbi:MAG: hypothetical protein COB73_00125 [Flavobacteriaceae bacterium]|nr:MAG: hypothetical protein COB73_00125 [Flavobacteriaceae bacterium]
MAIRSKQRLKTNLKLRVFLVFLSLSVILWLLINLSKTYTDDVEFEVKYINLPKDKVLQSTPVDQITASVIASGFNLLRYQINTKELLIDLKSVAYKSGTTFYYLPNKYLSDLKAQLNVDTKIDRVKQDTIFFNLGINISKRVPVELVSDIQFKLGYNLIDKIHISPDSVNIIGPKAQLDTIYKIKTNQLVLKEVSEEINQNIELKLPASDQIATSELLVSVTAKVDKFTEGSFSVPFTVINIPDNYSIATFPSEIEVTYIVALSNFSKITKESFVIECDFEQAINNELNYLIPVLKQTPALVSSYKITPNKIDFLIEK